MILAVITSFAMVILAYVRQVLRIAMGIVEMVANAMGFVMVTVV